MIRTLAVGALVACLTCSSAAAADLWVMAYHPLYQWDEVAPAEVPWQEITHLVLGYLLVEEISPSDYTVSPPDWYGDPAWFADAQAFVEEGHTHGRAVTCMLGGAGSNPGNIWNDATSEANVATFAANIVAVLEPLGFDGVDLDWEDGVDHPSLVRLAQSLRAAWPGAVITIPTDFAGFDAAGLAPAQSVVDAFMPMTYIAIPQWGGWTLPSPLTPLFVVGGNKNSIDWVRQMWADAGVPADKLLMGVGGFGLVWGDSNGDGTAPVAPYCNGGSGAAAGETAGIVSDNAVTQAWLTATLAENPGAFSQVWDDGQKISYWHSSAESVQVTVDGLYCQLLGDCSATADVSLIFYETSQSMAAKRDYVTQHGMRGVGFWTLSQMRDGTSYPILEPLGLLFADGFESGSLGNWSTVGP